MFLIAVSCRCPLEVVRSIGGTIDSFSCHNTETLCHFCYPQASWEVGFWQRYQLYKFRVPRALSSQWNLPHYKCPLPSCYEWKKQYRLSKRERRKYPKVTLKPDLLVSLFHYCNTPHSTTGVSPAKLIFLKHLEVHNPCVYNHRQNCQQCVYKWPTTSVGGRIPFTTEEVDTLFLYFDSFIASGEVPSIQCREFIKQHDTARDAKQIRDKLRHLVKHSE